MCKQFTYDELLYENDFKDKGAIKDWVQEGQISIDFNERGMILKNKLDATLCGDSAHFVFWCPEDFPDHIAIEWDFWPLSQDGLCMLFFAAIGKNGASIFDDSLPSRHGIYPEYHSGAINALHLSYYRRKYPIEKAFNTCNLRKSCGFHLVTQGADPIPSAENATDFYHMKVIKYEGIVKLYVNDLLVLDWVDDGTTYGPTLTNGKIGFRQMAPMAGLYTHLSVHKITMRE